MSRLSGWLRWISPWIALGLAAALAIVLLKPRMQGEPRPMTASTSTAPAAQAPAPKSGRYQLAVVLRHSGGRLASAAVELVVP